jgi:nucleotide-binding universal stress UspA family protein
MAYKTILVHIDAGKRCPARVEVAIRLARQNDAHLIGLNALTLVELPGYVMAEAGGASIVEIRKRYAVEQEARAKAAFSKALSAAGLTTAEWRSTEWDALDAVTVHGRYADLIVLGQPWSEDSSGVGGGFAEQVMLEAGRPVLLVPYRGSNFATIGKRILIAWNASREASRAVTDAISFLRQAESVQVVVINPKAGEHGAMPGSDIALHLARHGVNIEVFVDKEHQQDVGNEILSRAADFGADLIVMGAYGHSRFREMVMGGASRVVIDSMTMPVLLSH